MDLSLIAVAVAAALILTGVLLPRYRLSRLAQFRFPDHIGARVRSAYPDLSDDECEAVLEGLRQFFAISILAQGRRVAMPSRAVDTAWHEFILSTRAYQDFCFQVMGRFLHHTPAEAMRSPIDAQAGIRRSWRLACKDEGLDPKAPGRLPLLFAIDAQLAIPGGFTYALDCRQAGARGDAAADGSVYCASHIGSCGSGGDGDGCSGDSGGDGGGGCGGD
ncbi:hypothetical protein [Phenylobacterium sp.]|uniref:glycine-rich domain-containing protein n=1 Tax=Phenylobacterium sp. TaxID=1871053 RepID=UPI002ED85D0A